jgi:IS30 family transposase
MRGSLSAQGKEMALHKQIALDAHIDLYFWDPTQPLAARLEREHQRPAA